VVDEHADGVQVTVVDPAPSVAELLTADHETELLVGEVAPVHPGLAEAGVEVVILAARVVEQELVAAQPVLELHAQVGAHVDHRLEVCRCGERAEVVVDVRRAVEAAARLTLELERATEQEPPVADRHLEALFRAGAFVAPNLLAALLAGRVGRLGLDLRGGARSAPEQAREQDRQRAEGTPHDRPPATSTR